MPRGRVNACFAELTGFPDALALFGTVPLAPLPGRGETAFPLLLVEHCILDANIELQVGVAEALEQLALGGATLPGKVVALDPHRQPRLLVEVDDAAPGVCLWAALGQDRLDPDAAALVVIVLGHPHLRLVLGALEL